MQGAPLRQEFARVFRHNQDKKIVAFVVGLSALDVVAYLTLDSLWVLVAYWFLLFVPKGLTAPWNHHHQHCMTFRQPVLNRLLEISYGLHTGMTSNLWVLHHNLGHHVNYLDQAKDESRWRRKSGKRMGVIEYSLNVAFTSYYRAFRVGKRYPRHQRVFVVFGLLTLALVATLTYLRPLPALFVFVLPMISTLIYTSWVTYDHHAGLDGQDHYHASFNIMNRWFNRLTGNLGYHTAHHYKPGLHWSQLPALHAKIKHKIADEFFVKSTFDILLPDDKNGNASEADPEPVIAREGAPIVVAPSAAGADSVAAVAIVAAKGSVRGNAATAPLAADHAASGL